MSGHFDTPHHLPATEYVLAELTPAQWNHIAAYLRGVLNPLADVPGWEAERLALGTFASELAMDARAAGEPDPGSWAIGNREQRHREEAYLDYIDKLTGGTR